MDAEHLSLATHTVNFVSLFGLITNALALLTVHRKKALHNSFGIICVAIALNNLCVLGMNTIWYTMPAEPRYDTHSDLSRYIGYIGVTLWVFGCRTHFLISFNRFVATVFPFHSFKHLTNARTLIMLIALMSLSLLQNTLTLIYEDVWFRYDRSRMFWNFAPSERGQTFMFWLNSVSCAVDYILALSLDVITLIHLRLYRINSSHQMSDTTTSAKRSVEMELALQACAQCFPDICVYVTFTYITPLTTTPFETFVSTTVAWHLAHGIDGLIIDVFHTRADIFRRKTKGKSVSSVWTSVRSANKERRTL